MKKIRTMEDFARTVGLSRPTVSKFFNNPASVRTTTRRRIEAALTATGFRPNIFAVNLNRRRSKIIGLIIPDPMDPFYMALSRRIEVSATDAGYWAVVLSTNGRPKMEERAIETITSFNAGGAIIASVGVGSHRAKLKALARQVPLVFVDTPLDEYEPFVGTDNRQSIPLITEYLCRTGERPTFFDMPSVNHNVIERRVAYTATMRRLGLEPAYVEAPPTGRWEFEQLAFETATAVLRHGRFPTNTLLCANDRVAFGVIAALNEAGSRIGKGPDCQFRVAGHDNQPMSAFTSPPLTTVTQDTERMGQLAIDLLLAKMSQGEPPRHGDQILLSGELILRKSA